MSLHGSASCLQREDDDAAQWQKRRRRRRWHIVDEHGDTSQGAGAAVYGGCVSGEGYEMFPVSGSTVIEWGFGHFIHPDPPPVAIVWSKLGASGLVTMNTFKGLMPSPA